MGQNDNLFGAEIDSPLLFTDEYSIDKQAKGRPVLISALACKPDARLRWDRADFRKRLGRSSMALLFALLVNGYWSDANRAYRSIESKRLHY